MLSQIEQRLGRIFVEENAALSRLDTIFSGLSSKYKMNYANIIEMLKKRQSLLSIPASIFNNQLSPLENVALYLNVRLRFSQTQIANILKRDHTTIWTTLEHASRKISKSMYEEMLKEQEKILIPIKIFSNRKLSILESLSIYVKNKFGLSYHQIALLLGKNDRTIWTVVNRGRRKLGKINH